MQPARPYVPVLILAVVVAVAWSMYEPLKVQYQASRTYRVLARESDQLEVRNRTLQAEIADLKTPEGVERIARENLGLTLPGENVYIVMGSDTATDQAAAAPTPVTSRANDPLTVILDAIFGVGR